MPSSARPARGACQGLVRLLIALHCLAAMVAADYTYDDTNRWAEDDPACAGTRQSPIDIVCNATVAAQRGIPGLQLEGGSRKPAAITVVNDGHTAQYNFSWRMDSGRRPRLFGGPLGQNSYLFEQLHFHWGAQDDRGSEHTFDGRQYSLEAHFVFYKEQYGSFQQALAHPDGLSVLGILFAAAEGTGRAKWALPLPRIRKAGSSTNLSRRELFSLDSVGGADWDRYYSYPGSLTTPPCSESVIWIVRERISPVAPKDLAALRSLLDENGKPLVDNFRPVQPLNGRTVVRYGDSRLL